MRTHCLAIAILGTYLIFAGQDREIDGGERSSRLERYAEISPEAIKIPLPTVRQPDDYSCGAAALMSVCRYYGVGPQDLSDFADAVGTRKDIGTYFKNIVAFARQLGLEAEWHDGMTVEELQKLVGRGVPVICSIQAYAEVQQHYQDPSWNGDGHYVVAVGFDDVNVYFMDPSIADRRGYLTWEEFEQRWHENEGTKSAPEIHQRLGIEIPPPRGGAPFLRYAARVD